VLHFLGYGIGKSREKERDLTLGPRERQKTERDAKVEIPERGEERELSTSGAKRGDIER